MNGLIGTKKGFGLEAKFSEQARPWLLLQRLRRSARAGLTWSWLALMMAGFGSQFWLGFSYNSNETTNLYLQFARGSSYVLFLALCLLWLPVMKHGMAVLWRCRWTSWLPLGLAKNIHRWLGYFLLVGALIHAACYLLYFNTLDSDLAAILLANEPDVVRAMKTTMYEFVSEDQSIDDMMRWINNGMHEDDFLATIQPIMKEDCSKCHSSGSTMTFAVPSLPLSHFDDVVTLSQRGIYSRHFHIIASGFLMMLLLIVMSLSALSRLRKRYHHMFQHLHRLGYLMVLLALLHIPQTNWLIVPTLILAIECFLAQYLKIDKGQLAHISRVSDDILHFEMARPEGFAIKPGHYLQLRIPELKRYEWHPFSLTGGEGVDEMIVLKIKRQGDWTNQLFNLLRPQTRELRVDIRGPYASPVARASQQHHRQQQLLMIAGGIGITPFLGVMRSILANSSSNRQLHLVWVLRDSKLLSWLQPILNLPRLKTPRLGQIKIHLYLTDNAGPNDLPLWLASESENRVVFNQQRPEWAPLFAQIAQELEQPHCFVCGPDALNQAAANQCRRRGWPVSIEQF